MPPALSIQGGHVHISYCLRITCTAPGHSRCPYFLLPTHYMHCPRPQQMSIFPIAYTLHALPQATADVHISYCLHITCTAPGHSRCPYFLLPTHYMHMPQATADVHISYCLHVKCSKALQLHKIFILMP